MKKLTSRQIVLTLAALVAGLFAVATTLSMTSAASADGPSDDESPAALVAKSEVGFVDIALEDEPGGGFDWGVEPATGPTWAEGLTADQKQCLAKEAAKVGAELSKKRHSLAKKGLEHADMMGLLGKATQALAACDTEMPTMPEIAQMAEEGTQWWSDLDDAQQGCLIGEGMKLFKQGIESDADLLGKGAAVAESCDVEAPFNLLD